MKPRKRPAPKKLEVEVSIKGFPLFTKHFLAQGKQIMALLDEVITEVEGLRTVNGSVVALLEGLSKKLDDAGTDATKLQAVRDNLRTEKQRIADAVVAHTPGAGPKPDPVPDV